jgi:hypothetical protein
METNYEVHSSGGLIGGAIGLIFGLIGLAIGLIFIISMWKIFVKAGEPGWAAIVPIYNYIVLIKIVGKPIWWIVLLLIPCVNLVVVVLLLIELGKSFGRGALEGIIFPILAFSDAKYVGTKTPM